MKLGKILKGLSLILIIGAVVAVIVVLTESKLLAQEVIKTNTSEEIIGGESLLKRQAKILGLSVDEFKILDTAIHEHLYQKYDFLRRTEFQIRYRKVTDVENVPEGALVVDAYATFRTPPVVVRALFYGEEVQIIFTKEIKE